MSRKRSSKQRPPIQRRRQSDAGQPPPDRRALEKTMADLGRILSEHQFESIDEANAFVQNLLATGQPLDRPGDTPLEQAQDIMYQAWDAHGVQRIRLARKALTISEDCADAYVLLAEEAAKTIEEAKELYEKGVAAGERALGSEMFEENVGHFWGIVQTRPYMRARAGLAGCLYTMGQREEAAAHYQDMLRLNPGDNQGIRYLLAPLYLEVGADDALKALLDEFEGDISAVWMYTTALWAFRREGAGKHATGLLKKAIRQNPFVPVYLLGEKRLPPHLPAYVGRGDEDEAVAYAATSMGLWVSDPAAIGWLRETLFSTKSGPPRQ